MWLSHGHRGDQRRRHPAAAPDVAGAPTHIKVDGCVGQSFIRSYATLTSSTTDDVVAHYGVTKSRLTGRQADNCCEPPRSDIVKTC
jgi:hypothetical protein